MIISHKYKFIFIKTSKTAGTSIEVFLSRVCGQEDIVTPVFPRVQGHDPRNYKGIFNPIPELVGMYRSRKDVIKDIFRFNKYYNHIPAILIKERIGDDIWNNYYKFAVERNPWDKTLSHYYMIKSMSHREMTLHEYFKRGRFCKNYHMYTDGRGHVIIDEVVKYEDLLHRLSSIFTMLGVPFEGNLGVQAKSGYRKDRKSYMDIFSSEQIDIISKVFADEILFHNYRKEHI